MVSVLAEAVMQSMRDRFAGWRNEKLLQAVLAVLGYRAQSIIRKTSEGTYAKHSYSWGDLVAYGLNPATAAREYQFPRCNPLAPDTAHHLTRDPHPVDLAAMYLRHGHASDAESIMSEYTYMLEDHRRVQQRAGKRRFSVADSTPPPEYYPTWPSYVADNLWKRGPVLTVDHRPALPPLPLVSPFDSVRHLKWFSQEALNQTLEKVRDNPYNIRLLWEVARVSGNTDVRGRLQQAAYQRLKRSITGRFSDDSLHMIRISRQDDARLALSDARGVHRVLWAALENPSEEDMSFGLRALATATESTRDTVLKALRRAPTADELCSVKSKGLVDVLYCMPWEFLSPALRGDGLDKIRGHLARFIRADNMDRLQQCLTTHERRLQLDGTDQSLSRTEDLESWIVTYDSTWKTYEQSGRIRDALMRVTDDWSYPVVAIMEALGCDVQHLRAIAEYTDRDLWEKVKEELRDYVVPTPSY